VNPYKDMVIKLCRENFYNVEEEDGKYYIVENYQSNREPRRMSGLYTGSDNVFVHDTEEDAWEHALYLAVGNMF